MNERARPPSAVAFIQGIHRHRAGGMSKLSIAHGDSFVACAARGPAGQADEAGHWPVQLNYLRRLAARSACVPTAHMLSTTLTVPPGGTISSIRSSTSTGSSMPSAAR